MDIRDICYVIAIFDKKSITAAADSLFISQPALSQALRRIEADAGCRLFTRSGNAIVSTDAGKLLAARGRIILNARNKLVSDIRSIADSHRQTLRFGISPFYSKFYLPDVFQYYVQNLPNIHLDIVEDSSLELESRVLKGDLSFCFVPVLPTNPELHYRIIGTEEIFLAVPPQHPANALANGSDSNAYLDLNDVRDEPFILLPAKQKVYELQTRIFQSVGIQPRVSYATSNWDTAMILTAGGVGLSFLPGVLRNSKLYTVHPCFYHIAGYDASRHYAVAYRDPEEIDNSAEQLITLMSGIIGQKNTPSI